MSIQVSGLTKKYDDQIAVNAINFSINKGEIVGFLGPNGAGKSTTMKMLTGYIPPTNGSAEVAGFDIHTSPLQVKQKVGYLPEHNPLYTDMYVREYLHLIAGLNNVTHRAQKVEELIDVTGLRPESNKLISQLSKGYRQRVGLAQALINDPEVLILDEPTSGLDPNQLVDIRKLIRTIGKEKTVMLSTHIMQEVEQMCDRVIIIDNGHIVKDEYLNSISAAGKPGVEYKVEYLNEISISSDSASQFEVLKQLDARSYVVSGPDQKIIAEYLHAKAIQHNNPIVELSRVKQDLEALFRKTTSSKEE